MMMKKYASLLFALFLALSLSVSAAADSSGVYVYDDAALLTQEEYDTLTASAMAVADQYGCGVYVVTVDDMADYIPTRSRRPARPAWPPSPNTHGMRSGLPPPTTATASCSR